MKVQYFHASLLSKGEKRTLWNSVNYSPSVNLRHSLGQSSNLIVTFSTYRTYPSYYSTSESKRYHNNYRVDVNNPALKPYATYETHVNHVWHGKYIAGVYLIVSPDRVFHYSYQNPDELVIVNGSSNSDRHSRAGFITAIPYDWSKAFSSTLATDFYFYKMRGSYAENEVRFRNHDFTGSVNLSNSLRMLRDKSVLLQVSASYSLPYESVISQCSHHWNTTAAVAWSPRNSNWHFTLRAVDLLNTHRSWIHSEWQDQRLEERLNADVRSINLNVRYVFNSFKQKKVRTVDTSRMTALSQ